MKVSNVFGLKNAAIIAAAAMTLSAGGAAFGAATYINTSGTYAASPTSAITDAASNALATGVTLSQFTSDISAAYSTNRGGVFTAEVSQAAALPATPIAGAVVYTGAGTYGDGATKPIVLNYGVSLSKQVSLYSNQFTATDGIGPGTAAAPQSYASGSIYIGFSGIQTPTLTFTQNLSEVGITQTARGASRTDVLQAVLSNGTFITSTPETTNATGQIFYGFKAPAGLTITALQVVSSVDNTAAAGFTRFDDIGFVVAAVPEPTTLAAVAGLGGLLLRRRRSI